MYAQIMGMYAQLWVQRLEQQPLTTFACTLFVAGELRI
jgi:hypothetical protein